MTPTQNFPLLLIGEYQLPEFRSSIALLQTTAQITHAFDISTALETESDYIPQLILLIQAGYGIVSPAQIQQLATRWPLAKIVALLGSWSEGSIRTEQSMPGVLSLYWHEFSAWWSLNALGHSTQEKLFSLPISTANKTEQLFFLESDINTSDKPAAASDATSPLLPLHVSIEATEYETAASLAEGLKSLGRTFSISLRGRTNNPPPTTNISVGLWIGSQLDPAEEKSLQSFSQQMKSKQAMLLVLLDYPRQDSYRTAISLGAYEVLGMPCSLQYLNLLIHDVAKNAALK